MTTTDIRNKKIHKKIIFVFDQSLQIMKKEEFIKKAWQELNFEPETTDDNGYIDYESLPEDFDIGHLDVLLGEMTEKPRKMYVRPKSLNRIGLYDKFKNICIRVQQQIYPFRKRILFRASITFQLFIKRRS